MPIILSTFFVKSFMALLLWAEEYMSLGPFSFLAVILTKFLSRLAQFKKFNSVKCFTVNSSWKLWLYWCERALMNVTLVEFRNRRERVSLSYQYINTQYILCVSISEILLQLSSKVESSFSNMIMGFGTRKQTEIFACWHFNCCRF